MYQLLSIYIEKYFFFVQKHDTRVAKYIAFTAGHSDILISYLLKNNLNTLFNSLVFAIAVQPASSSAHIPQEICTAKHTPPASERKKYIE